MKNQIKGIDYIPATKVMAWLEEARQIVAQYPHIGERKIRYEHSFTRHGYKVSNVPITEMFDKIANYPHTSFQKRPELMAFVQEITKTIDHCLDYEAQRTVEVIRLSDGKHIMETPELAEMVVEDGVAKYA